jgi:hypothetical protein
MSKLTKKRNLSTAQIQAQKDKGVAFLKKVGHAAAAKKLAAESLASYAKRKGLTAANPRATKTTKRRKRLLPKARA